MGKLKFVPETALGFTTVLPDRLVGELAAGSRIVTTVLIDDVDGENEAKPMLYIIERKRENALISVLADHKVPSFK